MKLWALCTILVSAAALAACGSSGGGSGGAGGGGTGGSTGTNNMTTTGSSMTTTVTSTGSTMTSGGMTTTSSTSTSSSGGGSCDNKGVCEDSDMDPTNDCAGCALQNECSAEYQACVSDPDCVALNTCFGMCGQNDTQCLQSCAQQHPTGYQKYNAISICIICDTCVADCAQFAQNCP